MAGGGGGDLKIHRLTKHPEYLISSHFALGPIQQVFKQLLQKTRTSISFVFTLRKESHSPSIYRMEASQCVFWGLVALVLGCIKLIGRKGPTLTADLM